MWPQLKLKKFIKINGQTNNFKTLDSNLKVKTKKRTHKQNDEQLMNTILTVNNNI